MIDKQDMNCRGGGQVVSMFAFYSYDRSSGPAEAYSFFCKICVWKEWKKQRKHFLKNKIWTAEM